MQHIDRRYSDENIDEVIQFLKADAAASQTRLGRFKSALSSAFQAARHTPEEAAAIIRHYLFETTPAERDDATTEKIIVLYDVLIAQKDSPVAQIKRSSLERLRKERKPVKLPPPTPLTLSLQDAARKPYLVDPALLPKTSAKLLAHLTGDEFILNSKLEGSDAKTIIGYVLAYIQQVRQQGHGLSANEEELIHELKVALEIASAKEMDKAITDGVQNAFNENKPFVIPGGWIGIPHGHAVYYEVIPDEDGQTATIHIFNTGEGLQKHPRAQVGPKMKGSFVEWRGVTKENLLNPLFGKVVMEMNTKLEGFASHRTNYTFKDIYYKLKDLLEVKEVTNEQEVLNAPFSQVQLSGTCSCRCLMAFIKTKMSPNEFRHFKCDIRLQALQSEIRREEIRTPQEVVRWRLVQKSTKHLARKIHRMYLTKKAVGVEYLAEAEKVLSEAEEMVKASRHKAVKGGIPVPKPMNYSPPDMDLPKPFQLPQLKQTGEIEKKGAPGGAVTHMWNPMQKFALNDPQTILREVNEAKTVLQKGLPGDFAQPNLGLIKRMKELIAVINPLIANEELLTQCLTKISKELETLKGCVLHSDAKAHAEFVTNLIEGQLTQIPNLTNRAEIEQRFALLASEAQKLQELTGQSGEFSAIHFAALDFIKKLPLDKAFWQQVPGGKEEAEKAIADFNALSELFFQSCFRIPQTDISFPEKVYALKKIYLVLEAFAQRLDSRITLKQPKEGLWQPSKDESSFFQFHDERMQREWCEMEERKEASMWGFFGERKRPLFTLELSQLEMGLLVSHKDEKGCLCGEILQAKYPKEWVMIEQNYNNTHAKEFRRLEYEEQDQHIYLKKGLFPSWMANLIEMERRAFYLESLTLHPIDVFISTTIRAAENNRQTRLFIPQVVQSDSKVSYENNQIASKSDVSSFLYHFVKGSRERDYRVKDFAWTLKLIKKNVSFPLSTDEIKQLTHIFSSYQHHYAHVEFIEFFTRNPNLLHSVFHQHLFQIACFGMIQEKPPHFGDTVPLIAHFLKKSYDYCEGQGDKKTMVFLLRMGRYFSHYEGFAGKLRDEEAELLKLLKLPDLKPEERSIIYAELAAYYSELESLTPKQMEDLMVALASIRDFPIPLKDKSPQSEREGQKALQKHSRAIVEYFCPGGVPNQAALNSLYRRVAEAEPPGEWKALHDKNAAPYFEIPGKATFSPLTADLAILQVEKYLPSEIVENPVFRKLFPEQKKGVPLENGAYQFNSNFVKLLESQVIVIDREIDGAWYRHVNYLVKEGKPFAKSAIQSRYLAENYEAWQSFDDPATFLLEDPATKKPVYKTTAKTVVRLSDNALLGDPGGEFSDFEDLPYVQPWFTKDGKLLEIELPRYRLCFKPNMECREYPGWFIDKNQAVDALGNCSYNLVLTNSEGKRKILIPDHTLTAVQEKESQQPDYSIEKYRKLGQIGCFAHFAYDLDPQGNPTATTREAYFHLIKVMLIHHEYDLAIKYLRRHGEKLSAYTPQEQKRLEDLLDVKGITGDSSGNQNAVALLAVYLLATNPAPSEKARELLPNLYGQYLLRFTNSEVLDLTKPEELRILKKIFAQKYEPNLLFRLRELDPDYAAAIYQSSAGISEERTFISSGLYYNRIPQDYPRLTPEIEKSALVTRCESELTIYFCDYVRMVIQGTPEQKAWLKAASTFLCHSEKSDEYTMGIIFRDLLKQPPGAIRLPPEPTASEEELERWREHISRLVTAPQDVEKYSSPLIPATPATPENFRLETEEAPLPEIPFAFTPTQLAPLESTLFTKKQQPVEVDKELETWLDNQIKEVNAKENPLQVLEWGRLGYDLSEFAKSPAKTLYERKGSLDDLARVLETKDEVQEMSALSDLMLEMVNRLPTGAAERLLYSLGRIGGIQKEITLDDIFISLALKKPSVLQRLNRNLSEKELHEVYTYASRYLQLATLRQQKDRCLKLVQELRGMPPGVERKEMEQQLGEMLFAKRTYDPNVGTVYLVFEYYADILMRPDQKVNLDKFLEGKKANPVMEMIMASGKSKVLLPLLGLLRADGKILSLLIVPEALFESVSTDTQNILKEFAKNLRTLHFDRNTRFNKHSLEEIRDLMLDTIASGESLIMTSKSVGCLLLKFIEFAKESAEKGDLTNDEMALMQEIIGLLRTTGSPLIDEADTVMNILHELSFSIGRKVPPIQVEINLVGQFYDLLYNDPALKKIAKLESDPEANPAAPPLTEELYYSKLQRPLAEAFLKRLEEDQNLKTFFQELTEPNREILLAYLCRDEKRVVEAQKFYKSLPQELKDLFALAGEEISHLLPHSLVRVSDERYGLDQGVISIPFAAVNTPSHGSLFANSHITMNYTYQIHNKKGIDRLTLITEVRRLKKLADAQVAASGGKKSISDTEAWKMFCILRGETDVPLVNELSEAHIKALLDYVNSTRDTRRNITMKVFLPSMELFESKLSCNPIDFVSLFLSKVCGFTGTLWNGASMHRKINPLPQTGTDARTLSQLWKMSKAPDSVTLLTKGKLEDQLGSFDMISDAGGYFKEGGNLAIARRMALQHKKPVVFYNAKGEQTLIDGAKEWALSSDKTLSKDQRLTFLDQSHTTGADVPQRGQAVGIVTIGRNMLLRDLLQSVWRLRGLEKGQRVRYLIDEEVASIIRERTGTEKITFKEILKFAVQNQAKQQGLDNFNSFKQQVWGLPHMLLLDVLLDNNISARDKEKALNLLVDTWIKPTQLSPSVLYGSPAMPRPSDVVIEDEGNKAKLFLKYVEEQMPLLKEKIAACQIEIDDAIGRAKTKIHPFIICPLAEDAGTVEIQQDVKATTHATAESETDQQNKGREVGVCSGPMKRVADISSSSLNAHSVALFPIQRHMERDPDLKEYAKEFEGIDLSINVLEWPKDSSDHTKMKLLSDNRIPFHHLIVKGDEVTLLSLYEHELANRDYYNIYLGYKDPQRKPSQAAFEKITKLKFLNGESHYSTDEQLFLRRWLKEANGRLGAKAMQNLFTKVILKNQEGMQKEFAGSALEDLFATC